MSNAAPWLIIALLVGAPATLSGCASASLDRDEAPDLRPIPLEELAERLAAALCQALDSCCQAAALGSSGADCHEQARADYEAQLAVTSARAVRYDPISAARCVAAFTDFLSGCSYDGKAESDAACQPVFQGTQTLDQSCATDLECAPAASGDVYCVGDLGSLAHTCQPVLRENEPCLLEGCAQGLFCDLTSLTCQKQRSEGACFQFEDCSNETVCAPSGQCEPKLAAGEACQIELQCQSGVCGSDGRCAGSFANVNTCVSP